ncbi:MAG TPA: hypothetical protein VIT91_05495 [Chthoniobacterales bacterium]
MKTTIDIPDPLYRQAKIRAVEQGTSLKVILLRGLEHELKAAPTPAVPEKSYWANRKLRPGYAAALKAGAFSSGTDSTVIISEDRSSREEAISR